MTQAKKPQQSSLNQGFGEAFEESQAMNSAGHSSGGSSAPSPNPAQQQQMQQQMATQMGGDTAKADKPREVGNFKEELVTRPVADIAKGLASFADIGSILGINEATDTPEEQMKKKQMLQRYERLNTEQKQVADQIYQKEMEKKKKLEQEDQIKKQQKAQADKQSIAPPSSSQKGPKGSGGSGKQRAAAQLEQDRKTLNGPMKVD